MTGGKNLSWTKFRDNYLFTINFSLMLSVILYSVRKDFIWHPVIGGWLTLTLFIPALKELQKKVLAVVGHVNSKILLTTFYYLFFSPFAVFYRLFFRNKAFIKADSRFEKKNSISSFDRPF
jgi:hypothetical protein